MPMKLYTESEFHGLAKLAECLGEIIDGVSSGIGDNLSPEERERMSKDGRYRYIPTHSANFYHKLHPISLMLVTDKNERKLRFLDVGCGIGITLRIAYSLGFKAFGLELEDKYIEAAKRLGIHATHDKPDFGEYLNIIKTDIRKFRHYDKFDVIFMYCPLCDGERENKLERMILKNMKVGAYIIGSRCDDKSFKNIKFGDYNSAYQKIK